MKNFRFFIMTTLVLITILLVLPSQSIASDATGRPTEYKSIHIVPGDMTLLVGQTWKFSVEGIRGDNKSQYISSSVTWYITPANIIIENDGTIKASVPGEYWISAAMGNLSSRKAKLTIVGVSDFAKGVVKVEEEASVNPTKTKSINKTKVPPIASKQNGWSSETKYNQPPRDSVNGKIVSSAIGAANRPSGQSTTNGEWKTDIEGGDGNRFLKGIKIRVAWAEYDTWRKAHKQPTQKELNDFKMNLSKRYSTVTDEAINAYNKDTSDNSLKKMIMKQFDDSYYVKYHVIYNPQRKDVRSIIAEKLISDKTGKVPSDNRNGVLSQLGIQKQCLEWAMTIAIKAGGKSINYQKSSKHSVDINNITPGMGIYHEQRHAMIITDVYYEDKKPKIIKVAESNNANNFANPEGDIPWKRTIKNSRTLNVNNLAGYTVVKYHTLDVGGAQKEPKAAVVSP